MLDGRDHAAQLYPVLMGRDRLVREIYPAELKHLAGGGNLRG
jgi:hypothetical protein